MPIFQYTAKNKTATTVSGEIIAQNREEAIERISQLGLLPVTIDEESSSDTALKTVKSGKVRAKELYAFSRQLVSLLKAGISLLRALQLLEKQTSNNYLRYIITTLIAGIKDGKAFADCLLEHPQIFPPLYAAMVRAGEESGQLMEMLGTIAEYQKNQAEVSSKVRTALAYPIIMALLGVATVIFMLTYVMPQMNDLFIGMTRLPWPTQLVLDVSAVIQTSWWAIIGIIILIGLYFRQRLNTSAGRLGLSHFVLSLPFLGPFILKVEMARFCRALEMLLRSGTSILQALNLATPTLSNEVVKQHLEKCHESLIGGDSFGKSLKESKVIPAILGDLIEVGEESGSLSETLHDIADDYELEVNETIKVLTTLLEPIMIILVGAIIGFIVMAMLLPIFELDIYSR